MNLTDKKLKAPRADESGVVLVAALLLMLLISGIMVGMFAAINAEQRSLAVDRDQSQVYAAAHAGLEKLTSDLVNLFLTDVSPSVATINTLATFPPAITGFDFIAPGGGAGSGYAINFDVLNGQPVSLPNADITAGPYQGFKGLITPYSVTVTARSTDGGAEVRLRRDLQTVAVPVFQFGVFSDTDLTFYAGDNFNFGGRVHTNGNLYLSQVAGLTLTMSDRITALGQVVRSHLSNGLSVAAVTFTGTVNVPTAIGSPGTYRALKYTGPNEGSILGFPGTVPTPALNTSWTALSVGTYKNNIRNGLTGAKRLDLPIVSQGALPIDLIKRPATTTELVDTPLIYNQRYFSLASLRVLLSDRAADITDLQGATPGSPGVTAGAPVQLFGNWLPAPAAPSTPPAGYGPVDATHPPIALSPGPIVNTTVNTSTYANPFAQIHVSPAGIAAGFKLPTAGTGLTVSSTLGTFTNVNCTGKTITTFFGCDLTAKPMAVNGSVSVTLPSGLVVTAPATLAVAAGVNRTITLSTVGGTVPQPTAPFSPGLIWVTAPAAGSVPAAVSCEGYDTSLAPQRFTNCRGLTAAPANTSSISTWAHVNAREPLIGGFLKIEQKISAVNVVPAVWRDVTVEILNLGIGAPNQDGALCADPTPNAVLRLQRLRDNGNAVGGVCTYAGSREPTDWWPNALYDAREGNYRDVALNAQMEMGGVMQYVALDVNNLRRWLNGTIGANGAATLNDNGYIVYFSDRRGNHNWADTPHVNPITWVADGRVWPAGAADPETGEYGWEDVVNPLSATGTPNGGLPDAGEDVQTPDTNPLDPLLPAALPRGEVGWGTLQTYGATPQALVIPAGSGATQPFTVGVGANDAHPTRNLNAAQARVNRTVLFRRALKLINGGINAGVASLPTDGLTIVAENPVYVQGNYNATISPTAEPNRPAAILADAVTVLSNNWSDANSFRNPNDRTFRDATTTGYRFAVLAGKNPNFVYPAAGAPQFLFGTDGGVGNFLRLLEDWNLAGISINYRGSIVSLFYSRQATGTFRFSPNVYSFGTRNFAFDSDFLQPVLLPPGTPMFRDVNTLTFRQILRPNQ